MLADTDRLRKGTPGLAANLVAELCLLEDWRRMLAATVCGALSALAMAPFFLGFVLYLTLPALLVLIRDDGLGPDVAAEGTLSGASERGRRWQRIWRGALAGWCFGFGYHLAGLYWIGSAFLVQPDAYIFLMPLAVVAMPAGLALFLAMATAATAAVPARWLHPAGAFVIFVALSELARGTMLTGFPWNSFGYALTWPLSLMQAACVLGIYGLTAAALALAVLPAVLLYDRRVATLVGSDARTGWLSFLAVVVPLAGLFAFGAARLSQDTPTASAQTPSAVEATYRRSRIRLVQPTIPQREKWEADKQPAIFEKHLKLSRIGPDGREDGLKGITHVIWPEAAMPFGPLHSPEALKKLADLLPDGVILIAGILRWEKSDGQITVYNGAAVFDGEAKPIIVYDKTHLVPFGEYLPLTEWLEWIGLETVTRQRGGFAHGRSPRPTFAIPGLPPVELLVCYEVVFPQLIGRGGSPQLLVNLTNDGWFGHTSGPYQHLHQARVRAVEFGVGVLRVANNGISAVIDAKGRILEKLGLDKVGTIDTLLPRSLPSTPYRDYRLAGFFGIIFLTLLMALLVRFGRQ